MNGLERFGDLLPGVVAALTLSHTRNGAPMANTISALPRSGVWLCDHCSRLNDPRYLVLCPCQANTVTAAEVRTRHEASVLRATRSGMAGWRRAA